MRILHAANVRWFNATAWYALYLARLQRDAGHEVTVLVLPGTETHQKARDWKLDHLAVDLNSANPLRQPGLWRWLRRLVADRRPQVVDCHRGEAFILFGLMKTMTPKFALVRTRGDQRPPKFNLPNRWLHTRAADAVVATNSRTRDQLARGFGLGQDRLRLILGGVDRAKFAFDPQGRVRVRAEYGYSDKDVVVGVLGRFDEVKGQRELLQAVAALRGQGRAGNLKIMLAGFSTAIDEQNVRDWMAGLGLSDCTVITGHRPDVAALISAMDMGLAPSLWSETIARAPLEIMSCGVPLAASDVGVMPDLLAPDAMVPPGDVDALAGILDRAAGDPQWLADLAAEQARTMATLSGADFLEQTMALYREIVP